MCGGSDKEERKIGGKDPSPDPSTYSYNPMTPEEMYAQYRATGQVPYSYYGNGAPSSMDEYKAHRAYYGDSYVDKPVQSNQQEHAVYTPGSENPFRKLFAATDSETPFSKLFAAMLKNKQGRIW